MSEEAEELASSPDPAGPDHRRRRRRRKSRIARLRESVQARGATLLTILLTLVVAGSLLAVGTVHVEVLLVVAPVALIAGALAIWMEDRSERRLPRAGIIVAGLSLYSLLQAVPLPPRWLKTISPVAAQTWTDAFKLLDLPATRWVSLSVDPGASRVEALKWLCYAAVFIAAARLAREKGSQRGTAIVVGSALLGGILSIAHGLFGVSDWLGLYHPKAAFATWAPSPLLNPNNFASYLNLALFSGLGLLFVRKPVVPRWALGLAIAVLAALVILTGSRGGVLALVVGFALSGLAYRAQQARAVARHGFVFPTWLPLTGVGLAAAGLAVIGATSSVWQQLLDETTAKLRIVEYSLPLIRDHFWTGIGRGCFETAFPAYRQVPGHHIAQFAENFVVQWIVEWGVPVALVAFVGLGWTLRPHRLGFARNALPTGVLVAISVLLFENLFDLATEIASVGIAAFALLGTVFGGAEYFADTREEVRAARRQGSVRREPNQPMPSRGRTEASWLPTLMALASLLLGSALVWLVGQTGDPNAYTDRLRLAVELPGLVGKPKGDPAFARMRSHVSAAMLRHPADPYVPYIGALLTRESGKTPYPWLNQALRRDPLSAQPHLLLAETLAARGAMDQAFLELRKTAELAPELLWTVAERATLWTNQLEKLMRAVPEGNAGIPLLNAFAAHFAGSPERVALRAELFAVALKRNARDVPTNSTMANDLLAALAAETGDCANDISGNCRERLKRHAEVVLQSTSHPQLSVLLQARLLARDKKYDEAERWLAERCEQLPDRPACAAERVILALKLPEPERYVSAAMAYAAAACSTPAACSNAFTWLGNVDLGRNNLSAALARFERAAQESPSADAWIRVAQVALRLGKLGRTETAVAAARRLGTAEGTVDVDKKLKELQRTRLLEELGPSRFQGGH